ncbi:fibronectin type III domain-containing protein [Flagellimonas pelagia]|uniref:Fibronectin type-III domain-containing protein n=1 Tax=Flagellimonas pelagia TaxID=2306998 RepID=A0A3A1NCD5_9FLAO|nr:RNase A-like domain-containing protein [Allomuricauda maritima]RIV42065.1 hypothetical protein D2V05_18380 [Allomuricauda maritima]TXJ90950.1 hypothetical protein FQ017_18220 [Allomuricauda maritima]
MRTPEHRTMGKWLFTVVLFTMIFMIGHVYSQTYPVQVLAQYNPPTPIYLADFANTGTLNGPLRVQMVLNDLQIANRQVRLQVSFEGNGISFKSRENVIGAAPLFLEGGLPLVLDHTGLAPYFEFGNIVGIPPNVYGSAIPDGAYQVCFEVYDVLTGKRLSNTACATMGVFQNSPPLLVLPENGSDMVERNPQNIIFQWTPRHTNVSQVEYELSLVEIWDNALDPQAVFLASTPMFTVTTGATSYLYGPSDPMLLPNKRYAWRVQAKAKQGAEDIGMFLDQGYSQVFSFGYSEGCYLPNGIRHEVKGANQANVLWDDPSMDVPEFTVRYRTKGEGNEWFLNRTTANWTTLWDLKTGTTYEYQVQKACTIAESGWSPIRQFTTNLQTEEEDLYQCGVSPSVEITNQDPLPDLSVGESFMAGDFQVIVSGVNGGNGYFTGTGQVRLPYLGNIKVAVSFTNILVNTDRQLAHGTVVTEFDPTMGNILDTGGVVQTVGELGEAVGELIVSIRDLLENFNGTPEQIEQLQAENQQQGSYVEELLADESIPQNVKDELAANYNAYNASSQNLIEEATQGGPNPDGYDTANQLQAFNDLEASIEKAESYRGEEIVFGDAEGYTFKEGTGTEVVVYVSPAGVPVVLPTHALPKFYTVTDNPITAYGSLIGFTIEDGPNAGIYNGYRRGNEFTGYKTSKGDEPYAFGELPNTSNIQVRTIGGSDCIFLLFGGQYQPDNINPFGTGNLSMDWDKGIQWEVLFIGEQNYTTCIPPLDYDGFTEYFIGIYNPFGHGGFLRKVIASDGSVAHVYSIADQESGWIIHYQYNNGNGRWEPIAVPGYNVDTAAALDYLFGQVFSSAAGHLVLDMAGMVPAAGELFDFANGIWYTIEGDGTSAAISFASTIPLVYATTVKNVGRVIKLADGSYQILKLSSKEAEAFINQLNKLNLDDDALRLLNQDLNNKAFAEAVGKNPELLDSWRLLDNLGADEVLRNSKEALEYFTNGRTDKILLDVEELLGGHSKARHGAQLTMAEMEQRVLGTHPSMGQSRSALKFDGDLLHEDAVSQAFNSKKADIEAHFNSGQTTNFELEYDFGSQVGTGYTNTGTLSEPTSFAVKSTKVKLVFKADPTNPTGYILLTAYPSYP